MLKKNVEKKIYILINSDREFDYYNNLINKFPENFFIIINDHAKQVNYHSFKAIRNKKFIMLSDILKDSYKIDTLLSTGLGHLRIITLKSLLKFIYSRSVGLVICRLKFDTYLYKKFKRKFTAGGANSDIFDKVQIEKKISKIRICFPRGLDLNIRLYPEKRWVNTFQHFFCHSIYDKNIIKKNTNKKSYIIGYPRYLKKNNIKYSKKLKNILWMPSYPKYADDKLFNIRKWLNIFNKLGEKYNVTLKLHPKVIRKNQPNLILGKNINLITETNINLNELYDKNDLVISDYGGSIFSAVYNEKPLILLNNDINKYGLNNENLEIVLRNNFYVIKNFNEKKLYYLINKIKSNYPFNLLKIKKIKQKIFNNDVTITQIYKKIIDISNEFHFNK